MEHGKEINRLHRRYWAHAAQEMEKLGGAFQTYAADPAAKDVSRLLYNAYDPDAYYNENAVPLICSH